ncbi:hypothetical protein PC129_g2284 [Phytophthora cactorum]|uniref:Uncharacterized protein n=1 Tax=Phytophthora cactorum TaxID=29920 RepID=A0A329T5C2_9STRA|nr:hypothetical protein Pcac1_g11025 [Phytophthora cactorum]KAG2840554.1 hypothetical protein PC111_g3415 [Phytophthora cactorum]KAG2849732.1 hypothetical protein PC112_g68 [Phytophthora cactorum]KAG2869309.1 hypothetical protein PC113_g320 [Phytophthora cactorum]KAG2936268.1 hypothetical protein PC114_g251 [Phytophthora cactorum]
MDLLEAFMPDMGEVLAAQENAFTSVIATLVSQLQLLAATNERQAQRMAQLESTQFSMQLTIKEIQESPAPAPIVIESPVPAPVVAEVPVLQPAPPDASVLDAIASLTTKMEELQQNVQQQVAEQMQQALVALQSSQSPQNPQSVDDAPTWASLEQKFRELDEKVSIQIGELRSVATDSLAEKTKQTEEAVKNQLEQLEKRFDYLSRVKMEIKELMRRADKHEQSIEDVRIGLEVLAKSLGSDDIDSETSDEEDETAEEQELKESEEESPPQPVVRKSALLSIPVFEPQQDLNVEAEAKPEEPQIVQQEEPQTESHDKAEVLTVLSDAPEPPQTEAPTSQPLRSKSIAQISKHVRRSLRRSLRAVEAPAELIEPPAPIPEPVVEQPIEEHDTAPATPVVQSPRQQSEGERTTETIVAPEVPEPVSVPTTPTVIPDIEDHHEEEKPQEPVRKEEETHECNETEDKQQEELPQQYRSQLATQQKVMDDQVELFRSSSSKNLLRSNVATPVRTRRQRRSTNPRKTSDVQPNDHSSVPTTHEPPTLPVQRSITPPSTAIVEPHPPLTKARIRELWMFLLSKLVRLQRLRQLNGINAEKALFRRQQMSMGSRVKRLEENTARLDESCEYLERHVQDNSSAINALDGSIAELHPVLDRVQKMERSQKSQARTIVDVEEKLQEIDVEVQRLRTSVLRNNSLSTNVTSAVTNAISAQLQDVTAKFSHHTSAFEASEKLLTQVNETEIPALHDKIELSLYTIRQEAEQRTNEAAQELQKIVEQLQTSQRNSDGNLLVRITDFCNRIYHTLLGMSGAMLQSVELSKFDQSSKTSTRSSLDVGIDLLHGIFTHFITNCESLLSQDTGSEIEFLIETSKDFQQQLEKLKGQAAIARAAAHALETGGNNDAHGSNPVQNSSFDDHLVFVTTTKLKELEVALITREAQKEGNQAPELVLFMHDAVVQVRSILFLLLLHTDAIKSRLQVEELRSSHTQVQNTVVEHGFALGHLDSTIALVKMMNTRLDSFMELSFAYAKEEDVKKSIEELMTANNDMRDLLTTSLEANRSETLERDGLLGEEMNQLIARVSRKLDKDELLWTQEVLERQVQNVANASLDEHDLIDIHRRLRRKVDKNQLNSFLQNQRGQLEPGSRSMTNIVTDAGQKSAPLVGAKCISCQGELPPSKAMIKTVVREEVHQELAKSRAQKTPPNTFNASNHRNLDQFKKELLLSSLKNSRK